MSEKSLNTWKGIASGYKSENDGGLVLEAVWNEIGSFKSNMFLITGSVQA